METNKFDKDHDFYNTLEEITKKLKREIRDKEIEIAQLGEQIKKLTEQSARMDREIKLVTEYGFSFNEIYIGERWYPVKLSKYSMRLIKEKKLAKYILR